MTLHVDARKLVAEALAAVLQPAEIVAPSRWAADNLTVPDGPRAGERWNAELTPYIVEPLDKLGPDAPENEIAVMKSAQSGFTMLLIAAVGHSIDRDPCRIMVIQPTDSALSDFNREKLQPAIEGSPALSDKVAPQMSRSGQGSTTYSKKFPGGSLTMAIASSAADLRSKTIRKLFRDEIDQYPDDLDGQGDPLELSDARLFSFLAQGDWKKIDISTPTIKGGSKIERRYEQGDKRRWHVPCPGCGEKFVFAWGPNFKFSTSWPHKPYYVAPCCGTVIEPHQRNALVRAGSWIASDPRPGAFPSYHFDALSSPFAPWENAAAAFVAAGDNSEKLKAFWNLWLGLPFEIKGDAPDHVRLLERREEGLARGHIPPRGLMLVASADVQMRGLWVEVIALAPNRESWVVEALYLDGSTESVDGDAFEQLKTRVLDREWPDAFGRTRKLDALGVDSGYRSHVVYAWVRKNQRMHADTGQDIVFALDGRDGWGRPAIGTPGLVDINLAGAKVKKGCKLWPVGTWPLKAAFYADVRKEGVKSGAPADPEGYCHFADWLDENYFRQITAEYIADEKLRGKVRKIWKLKASERDNHLLDCFDEKTQLLTEGGWVGPDEIGTETRFATVNLATDEIEFQRATSLVDRAHDGPMVEIKGRRIDILVTPNHRMVTYRTNPRKPDPEINLAGELKIWDTIKLTAKWRGDGVKHVDLPAPEMNARANNRNRLNSLQQAAKVVDAGDLAEFLGWYVAEGHRGRGAGHNYGVVITQRPGEKQDRIVSVMRRLGFEPWVEFESRILVYSKQLFELVTECYEAGPGRGCYRKRVPPRVKAASPNVIERFVEAAIAGDGWTQRGFRSFATTSPRLADDMQELFIKLGRSSNIKVVTGKSYNIRGRSGTNTRSQFHVTECSTKAALLRQKDNTPIFRSVPYQGRVFCVTVPNGTLIARRSGKSFIAGNCRVYNLAIAEHLGLSSLTKDEWARLAKSRGLPDPDAATLFAPPPEPAPAPVAAPPAPPPPADDDDLDAFILGLGKANADRFR